MVNQSVPAAGSEDVIVPGECANASGVASHCSEAARLFSIVDLHEAFICADGNVGAALDPGNRCHQVVIRQFAEFGDFARGGVPHVDTGAKANAKDIRRTPVD